MNQYRIQRAIGRMYATSGQRFALAGVAFLSIIVASLIATTLSDASDAWVLAIVLPLAIGAVVAPDAHVSTFAVGVVVLHATSVVEDRTDIRVAVIASMLLVFHTLIALMAVTPHVAIVEFAVLITWVRRFAVALGATWIMWTLAVVFDRNSPPAGSVLTVAALVVALLSLLGLRARTFPREHASG